VRLREFRDELAAAAKDAFGPLIRVENTVRIAVTLADGRWVDCEIDLELLELYAGDMRQFVKQQLAAYVEAVNRVPVPQVKS